jgi:hypothetical protein
MRFSLRPLFACAAIALIAASPADFDRAELEELEAERAEAVAKLKLLEDAEESSAVDMANVDTKLISAAAESRRREEIAANSERKLIDLNARLGYAKVELSEDEAAIKDLVAALVLQGGRRPPALVVSPDKANDAVRTAMLLSHVTPRIQAHTDALTKEIEQLTKLEKQVRREQARLAAAEATLALKTAEIEKLAIAKRAHYEDLTAEADQLRKKVAETGGEVIDLAFLPDDDEQIAAAAIKMVDQGANLIISTGGMSVDPDDRSRYALKKAGAVDMIYGSPVLPGAMFMVAYLRQVPVLGIPACGMYAARTILDMILPRVLTGEKITRTEIAKLGHGGLCLKCKTCSYPVCPFGK